MGSVESAVAFSGNPPSGLRMCDRCDFSVTGAKSHLNDNGKGINPSVTGVTDIYGVASKVKRF